MIFLAAVQKDRAPLLTDLLKSVSRSFYLTLRVLPAPVRPQIGLAYLLARTTDTIADTSLVPIPDRLEALESLRHYLLGKGPARDWAGMVESASPASSTASPSQAESMLLRRIPEMVQRLEAQDPGDQHRIRQVLDVITGGQWLDLQRFGQANQSHVVALEQAEDLDDYTYRVAGCVGAFWTHLCRRHLFPGADLDEAMLIEDGIRFGKGLQLVNVLRDLPRDLQSGRCYLPRVELETAGLKPADLLQPGMETKVRPVYDAWLATARSHLAAGWRYTCRLPRRHPRLRLACAWPLLLGVQTLNHLETSAILDPQCRVKVSRAELRRILGRSLLLLPRRHAWEREFERLAGPVEP